MIKAFVENYIDVSKTYPGQDGSTTLINSVFVETPLMLTKTRDVGGVLLMVMMVRAMMVKNTIGKQWLVMVNNGDGDGDDEE